MKVVVTMLGFLLILQGGSALELLLEKGDTEVWHCGGGRSDCNRWNYPGIHLNVPCTEVLSQGLGPDDATTIWLQAGNDSASVAKPPAELIAPLKMHVEVADCIEEGRMVFNRNLTLPIKYHLLISDTFTAETTTTVSLGAGWNEEAPPTSIVNLGLSSPYIAITSFWNADVETTSDLVTVRVEVGVFTNGWTGVWIQQTNGPEPSNFTAYHEFGPNLDLEGQYQKWNQTLHWARSDLPGKELVISFQLTSEALRVPDGHTTSKGWYLRIPLPPLEEVIEVEVQTTPPAGVLLTLVAVGLAFKRRQNC